jgi:dinuclear metal center YbgI/SA1388 family protein
MITFADAAAYLNQRAPLSLQGDWDNSRLQVGNPETEITGILTSLDLTAEVIEEALQQKANFIVAHHPLIFKGLKSLTGANEIEQLLLQLLENKIGFYACHTNMDEVKGGVNSQLAELLGLRNPKPLMPHPTHLRKLTTFVPASHAEQLHQALAAAGAGNIGNYSHCSFQAKGSGTFKPLDGAQPFIGQQNELERVEELRLEMVLTAQQESRILKALHEVHPYETPAYFLQETLNNNPDTGAGMVGELTEAIEPEAFLQKIAKLFNTRCIRHTRYTEPIQRVAVCGGSGSFLIDAAKASGAQAYVTGDIKYHAFFGHRHQLLLADVGHYESEQFAPLRLRQWLQEGFSGLRVEATALRTNPIQYFIL